MSDTYCVKRNPELIDRKVIEDIKADINHLQTYKLAESADFLMVKLDDVISMIDKHCGGDNE